MKKTEISLSLIIGIIFICQHFWFIEDAYAVSANDGYVFLKQPVDGDGTCVFTSCLNMFRRRAIIDGISGWEDITHSNYKNTITTDGVTVRWTITDVKGMNAERVSVSGDTTFQKKEYFQSLLSRHPEGIVIYCGSGPRHTVLLTDYTDGIFYCIEPLNSYPSGKIPLISSYIAKYSGLSQDETVAKISQIWYVSNRSYGNIIGPPTNVSVSTDKNNYAKGETVTFSCSGLGVTGYAIGIDKDGKRIYTGDINDTFKMKFTEEGNYSAYVTAWNSAGGVNSPKINFYIYSIADIPVYTTSIVKIGGDEYTLEIELHNIDVPCNVFAAGYGSKNITDVKSQVYNKGKITFTFKGNINSFKVFVWDIETIKPICKAEVIPRSEWIAK